MYKGVGSFSCFVVGGVLAITFGESFKEANNQDR
jgi:hypothetical protein